MFDLKSKTSRNNEITALVVMSFMILALAFKAILPAGFMPVIGKDGVTEIVICSGMGEKTITVPSNGNPESGHQDQEKTDQVCAFQVLASGKSLLNAPAFTLAAPVVSSVSADDIAGETFLSSINLSFTARGPPSA